MQHAQDTASFHELDGDVGMNWKVNEYLHTILQWRLDSLRLNAETLQGQLERVREQEQLPHLLIPMWHLYVRKEALLNLDSLAISVAGYHVLSFSLANNNQEAHSNQFFSSSMKHMFRDAKPGEWFGFYSIVVMGPDGKRQRFPSLEVKISE